MTISCNDDCDSICVKCKSQADQYVEEMVYIMDVCNISDLAYHEIAQRNKTLPRACTVFQKRRDLNKSCSVFHLDGEYKGVYLSLKTHLVHNLSDPRKAYLLQDKKIKIKFSGEVPGLE